jgi:hypothetical protein
MVLWRRTIDAGSGPTGTWRHPPLPLTALRPDVIASGFGVDQLACGYEAVIIGQFERIVRGLESLAGFGPAGVSIHFGEQIARRRRWLGGHRRASVPTDNHDLPQR